MGRYPKEGLDYFTVDCKLTDAEKLILAEFGLIGLGILTFLKFKIYGEEGYYTKWDSDVAMVFSSDFKVGATVVNEVVRASLKRGIFDSSMYDRYGILTSVEIQEKCAAATARRISKKIDSRYLLISAPKNWISVDRNPIYVNRNAENVDGNTQSKVKENTTTTGYGMVGASGEENSPQVVGNSQAPPTITMIAVYMKNETSIEADDIYSEATAFYVYNTKRNWDCMPNWKETIDLWAARRYMDR